MHPAIAQAHWQLVERLIARGALWSPALIAAFRETPRHVFLDRVYAWDPRGGRWRELRGRPLRRATLRFLFSDRALTTHLSVEAPGRAPVPISSSSQPSLMAQMLEDLDLRPGLRTLEIGAGTGYNAALLAHAAGPVVSLDIDAHVVEEARQHLRAFPQRAVEFHASDGRAGWPAGAPYDRVQVTAAARDLEPAWLTQTTPGGVVQAPLALAPGLAYLVQGRVDDGIFIGRLTRPAYFIALRAPEEAGEPGAGAALPEPDRLQEVPAPWAAWAGRQAPVGGLPFVRSLAFLAWLEGLAVAYRTWGREGTLFGIGDAVQGHACWLGLHAWRVTGPEARALGDRLWKTFLDAGGPWPTEFQLTACAPPDQPTADADAALTYWRQGPRTRQLWQLPARRVRPPLP